MPLGQHGNSITTQCLPVNVSCLRASSQLLYELTCRRVENSNKSPLWKHNMDTNQQQQKQTTQQLKNKCSDSQYYFFFVNSLQPWHGLLSLMQQLSACPADLEQCSTAPPHEQGYQLGASRCWPGPLSARGLSESRGTPAGSCCCWGTAHKDLKRTEKRLVMM